MILKNAEDVVNEVISFLANQKHQFEMIDGDDMEAAMDDVSMIGSTAITLQQNGVTDEQLDSLIRLVMQS